MLISKMLSPDTEEELVIKCFYTLTDEILVHKENIKLIKKMLTNHNAFRDYILMGTEEETKQEQNDQSPEQTPDIVLKTLYDIKKIDDLDNDVSLEVFGRSVSSQATTHIYDGVRKEMYPIVSKIEKGMQAKYLSSAKTRSKIKKKHS